MDNKEALIQSLTMQRNQAADAAAQLQAMLMVAQERIKELEANKELYDSQKSQE